MPYQSMPQYKSNPDKMLEISQPGIGGLNLKDLEFEQDVNQTPYMLNMMYRNGAFGKRYGQEIHSQYSDTIYAVVSYGGDIIVHAGTKMYKYSSAQTHVEIASGLPQTKGLFVIYAQTLYYIISSGFYQFKNNVWSTVNPTIPDVLINCKPDGTYSDPIDDFNILGSQFRITYNGEAGVTEYKVYGDDENVIDWNVAPTIVVNDSETTAFTVDSANKKITFSTAPGEGNMNVVMTFTLKSTVFSEERSQILSCKYYDTFGGANNSRLFLAGGGYSKYFYSDAYDIAYFPESNFATLGNTEEDITGFGRQYNVLIVLKPKEVYSIYSYTETTTTTVIEENVGLESFRSQLVNPRIGCDCPSTIQLINNQLTWFNSNEGVCTLVSTNIQDERNVRVISRNVEHTNNFGVSGILDFQENHNSIQSADYDNKYFLVFPESGLCYAWDYEISPYKYSSSGETSPSKLCWFLFDHFYVKQFVKIGQKLLYASSKNEFNDSLILLNSTFVDLDFDGDNEGDAIRSYYMTPFLQFGAVEYLKNVKNIYVQCRGDTKSIINLFYYTDDSSQPEADPEPIETGSNSSVWEDFEWDNFSWFMNIWGNVFRRKCNLKKIQMSGFYFENNEVSKDLSITHVALQYQIIKNVR